MKKKTKFIVVLAFLCISIISKNNHSFITLKHFHKIIDIANANAINSREQAKENKTKQPMIKT